MDRRKQFVGYDHRNIIIGTLKDAADERGLEMQSLPDKDYGGPNDWAPINVELRRDGRFHASFLVQQMPGCCAVLTLSYVTPEPYMQPEFQSIVSLVEGAAREAGFGSLILTQVPHKGKKASDEKWGLLLENGYLMSKPFLNAKSGNYVVYLTKDLGHKAKIDGLEVAVWA